MNDYEINYLAAIERERNLWKSKYNDLIVQTRRLFFGFIIAMTVALIAILNTPQW